MERCTCNPPPPRLRIHPPWAWRALTSVRRDLVRLGSGKGRWYLTVSRRPHPIPTAPIPHVSNPSSPGSPSIHQTNETRDLTHCRPTPSSSSQSPNLPQRRLQPVSQARFSSAPPTQIIGSPTPRPKARHASSKKERYIT